jgi:hypothetical protein
MASAGVASCVTSATRVTFAAYVAAPTAHLVSVKVIESLVSPGRMWTNVTVMRIEAVINVATEVAWAVEPGTGSDEHRMGRSCMGRRRSSRTGSPAQLRY